MGAEMMNEILIVDHLYKSFGKENILRDIHFSLEKGCIAGITGRNGSGKTVLMKCILGFLRPEQGSVTVFGKMIGKDCDFAENTGMIIETPGFIDTESGISNLRYLRRSTGKNPKSLLACEEAMDLVGLDPGNKKPVSKYSLGMRQRLGLAQALMDDPDLLILDEPMNGLDNSGVEQIRTLLLDLRERGKTILLCSHNPLDIDLLCDVRYAMNSGVMTLVNDTFSKKS